MIPLIKREVVERRHWVAEEEFVELLTLAQSAPGPISLNVAVFVGYRLRSYGGALSAIAGVVLPSFVIILLIAMFFRQVKDNPTVAAAFSGMRPAVVALMLAPIVSLARGLGLLRIACAAVAAFMVWYFGLSPIYFIVAGAAAGILYTLYTARKEGGR